MHKIHTMDSSEEKATYCIACSKRLGKKTLTKTLNAKPLIAKNGAMMSSGVCAECGKKKVLLVRGPPKTKKGEGIADKFIEKLPVELHLVDFSDGILKPKRYNFCGPGTKLDKRLNADGTPKPWSKPINKLDQGCMAHDLVYTSSDPKVRDDGDAKLKAVAKEVLADSSSGISDKLNAKIVDKAMDLVHRGAGKHRLKLIKKK